MGNQNGSMVLGLKTRIKYVPWPAGWCMGRWVCAAPPCPRECRCVSVFSAGHWLSVLSHVHQGTAIWMEDLVGTALHYYLPGTGMKWGDTAHKLWPAREHHTGLCPPLSLLSLPWDLGQSACPRCRGDDYRSIVVPREDAQERRPGCGDCNSHAILSLISPGSQKVILGTRPV